MPSKRKSTAHFAAMIGGYCLYQMLDFFSEEKYRERFLYQHFARRHTRGPKNDEFRSKSIKVNP